MKWLRPILALPLLTLLLAGGGYAYGQYANPPPACGGDLLGNAPNCYVRKAAIAGARSLNMGTTGDQTILVNNGQPLPFPYFFTNVVLANCTALPSTLTVGGVFTGPGATGTAMVPAGTGFGTLSGVSKILATAMNGVAPAIAPGSTTTLYFHLGTASTVPATCDVLIYGNELALPGGT